MPNSPIQVFTSLYCGSIALQATIWYRDQLQFFRTNPSRIYGAPPRFLGVLPLPAVSESVFAGTGIGFVIALAAATAGFAPRWTLLAALICFLVYFPQILPLGYIQRKANLIPIVLTLLIAVPAQTIFLVKLALSLVYLSAAFEKLLRSGFRWVDGRSLQASLIGHYLYSERPQALWLARHGRLCRILSVCVLAWELSFWLVLVFPELAWVYVPAGLLFHAGTSIAMRIHYWIYFCPAYFVFIAPWLSARI